MSLPRLNLKFTKKHLKPGIDWARIQDEIDAIDIPGGYLHRDLMWILQELASLQMGYEDEAPETNEDSLLDAAFAAQREAYGNRVPSAADRRKLENAMHALRAQATHFQSANTMRYREGKIRITSGEINKILREAMSRKYEPDLMSARHGRGNPTHLSIALDIAWQDILDQDQVLSFDSPRLTRFENAGRAYQMGYYTFFRYVAEKNRVPGMGQFDMNPDRDFVAKYIEEYFGPSADFDPTDRTDRFEAAGGFARAYQEVDQMRKIFYRAGPRPETWSS